MGLSALKTDRRRLLIWLALTAVLGLAAYLRLSHLDLVEFKYDEATVAEMARAIARGASLPLVGNGSSLGTNNPAVFVYLMALPFLFFDDAAIATGFVGLLGALAVFGCYRLARTYFGELAAIIASLLFAVSPWAVMYSRKIWPQNVLPLFAILFVSALCAYAVKGRSWQLSLAFLWLALLVQIHPSTLALALPLLVVLLFYRAAFRWTPLLVGLALALASSVPYLVWQFTHNWADLQVLLDQTRQAGTWDGEAARLVFDTVATRAYYAAALPADGWLYNLQGVLFVAALAYILLRLIIVRQQATRRSLALLFLWLAAPAALLSHHSVTIHPHYVIQVYPAQFIVLGIFLADFSRHFVSWTGGLGKRARRMRLASVSGISAIAILLVAVSVLDVVALNTFFGSLQQGPRYQDYGLPLRDTVATVAKAVEPAKGSDSADVYLVLAEDAHDFRSAFDFVAGGKHRTREFDSRLALALPTGGQGRYVYVAVGDATPSARMLDKVLRPLSVPAAGQTQPGLATTVYRIDSVAAARVLQEQPFRRASLTARNGVQLIGWDAPRVVQTGDTLMLTTAWRTTAAQERRRGGYSFFAHLVDTRHVSWGGFDTPAYHPSEWARGDTVINWFPVPVGAGAPLAQYWVEFGMYEQESLRRITMTTEDGIPVGDAVRFGPIKVVPRAASADGREPAIGSRQEVWLEDQVQLLGYDISGVDFRPGQKVGVRLLWRAGAPKSDYTVFVHLINSAGKLVAQSDSPPQAGAYPTSLWDEGEHVADVHEVSLPADSAEGSYRVMVGMYVPQTGERLKALDTAGRAIADSIELRSEIRVSR